MAIGRSRGIRVLLVKINQSKSMYLVLLSVMSQIRDRLVIGAVLAELFLVKERKHIQIYQ